MALPSLRPLVMAVLCDAGVYDTETADAVPHRTWKTVNSTPDGKLSKGDRVWVHSPEDDKHHPATVHTIRSSGDKHMALMHWDQYPTHGSFAREAHTVKKRAPLKGGDKVWTNWQGEGKWYAGKVHDGESGNHVHVVYEGHEHEGPVSTHTHYVSPMPRKKV